MSWYPPEADEAQYGQFNDGFSNAVPSSSRRQTQRSRSLDHDAAAVDSGLDPNTEQGSIPQRVPKRVNLFHGNFVLDSAVSHKLLAMCLHSTDREFTNLRYSAVTCDPNGFKDSAFTLRQIFYQPPRRTELFIGITMRDEDEKLFCRTWHSVMRNIAHLCARDRSKTWGKDAWKKIVVCIISDGRGRINPRTLNVIATLGAYQEAIAKTKVGHKPVTAHLYEYTTQISVNPSLRIETSERGVVPVQVIFCLKEQSQGKINSHRWFFHAFGPTLCPNICILLDAGMMPGPTSIYHLWKAFDINSNLAGVCGEIVARKDKYWHLIVNPLLAAQNFEYKMLHMLDKPRESIFGHITTLPSAFSGFRYIALQNDARGEGPLQKYFLYEESHDPDPSNAAYNVCLLANRILCWELVSKRSCAWLLHYVKSAYAESAVAPNRFPKVLSERRQGMNDSFFASAYSIARFYYIYRSSHSFLRKAWIHIQMLYEVVNLIFSWFALANYYITFAIISESLEDPSFGLSGIQIANRVLTCLYVALVFACFVMSLLKRLHSSKIFYTTALVGFAAITMYLTVAVILLGYKGISALVMDKGGVSSSVDLFRSPIFRNVVFGLASTLGLYALTTLICFEPWLMITSLPQFFLMAYSYVNVLDVYEFANLPDGRPAPGSVTPSAMSRSNPVAADVSIEVTDIDGYYENAVRVLQMKESKQEKQEGHNESQGDCNRRFKINVLLAWVVSNTILAAAITSTNSKASSAGANAALSGYMSFLIYWVALLAAGKFLGSSTYMIVRLFVGE